MNPHAASEKKGFAFACAAIVLSAGIAFGAAAAMPTKALAATPNSWNTAHTKYYEDGKAVTGAKKINGKWRAFDKSGKLKRETFKLKGVTYYPSSKGILRARKANGSLRYANNRVMVKGDRLDFECLIQAEKVVKKITKKSDSMATKRYKCFKYISMKNYAEHRKWTYKRVGWPAIFAMDQLPLDKNGGECVADAASFAYLAAAIGYKNVYLCTDTMKGDPHAWVKIGNRIFDTMFARVKSWSTYYNSTGGSYEKHPTQRFAIPQYSPSHAGKKNTKVQRFVVKQGLKKENGSYCFYVNNKKQRNTWKTINGKRYWFRANGKAAVKSCKISKAYYVFNEKGQLMTGKKTRVVKIAGTNYQVAKTGKAKQGWGKDRKHLYFENGSQAKGSCFYKGKLYFFDAKGIYNKAKTSKLRSLAKQGASGVDLVALLGKPLSKHSVESCVEYNGKSGDDVVYQYPHITVQNFTVTQKNAEDKGTEYVYSVNAR